MDYIRDLRERISIPIPTLPKERLYSLLALVAMIVIGIADIFFVRSYIVPRLQDRKELDSQLISAEKALAEAKRAQEASPDKLREQIEAAQAKLDEVASAFLSDSQAAEALNKLYQYASESQVEIVNLQIQPSPEEEEKSAYDVRKFRLQADGDPPDLMDFVTRIKEAAFEGFIITNVNITEGEEQHILSMDVTLYTSPYSSGAAVEATPGATPTATPVSLAQLKERLDIAWASGEWEQAISLIEQILAIEPDYDDMTEKLYAAHVNYGDQLLGEGNPDGATAQFEKALEINPDGKKAQEGLDRAAASTVAPLATPIGTPTPTPVGTPEPTLPPTPTGPPTPTLTVEEQLAQSLHESWAAKDWEEVIGLIGQILAINPDYDGMTEKLYAAHVNYGRQLAAEGRLEEAKEEFTRALAIKPDGGEAIAELQALAGETPVPLPTPTQPQYIIHVVQRGENLFRIALRYGTTVQAIMAANGLPNYNIYIGQQLHIPIQ